MKGAGGERSEDLAACDDHLDALRKEDGTVTNGLADVVLAAASRAGPEYDLLGTLDDELAGVGLGLEDHVLANLGGGAELGSPLGDLGRAVNPVVLLFWAVYVSLELPETSFERKSSRVLTTDMLMDVFGGERVVGLVGLLLGMDKVCQVACCVLGYQVQ